MSQNNRVIWSEGLFLRPHHFQQLDRYHEHLLQRRIDCSLSYGFGFTELRLDRELLKLGKVGLAMAAGVMPDGTPFQLPGEAALPPPLDVPDNVKDVIVCLTLPLRRPGMADSSLGEDGGGEVVRYRARDFEVRDAVAEHDGTAMLKVGHLNFRVRLAEEVGSAHCYLAFARIREKRADGMVVMEDSFIPPVMDTRVNARLSDYLSEIVGLLRHRAAALAERVSQPGSKGVADFSDFLLLQLCNRCDPVFAHLASRALLHPEMFYTHALALAGELGTYGRRERRTIAFPAYDQTDLDKTFQPVIEEIRRALTAVLDQTAIAIPLIDKGRGAYVGEVKDVNLLRSASFILSVNADLPSEQLRTLLPTQMKIGPVEKLRDLVMSHLPGVSIRPLPVAPRQIPYHAGYTYFELDRHSEFWKGVEVSRVLAMHVAGDFPGLIMELWAIRD
jgi:type VI secretion system protein ImpJ